MKANSKRSEPGKTQEIHDLNPKPPRNEHVKCFTQVYELPSDVTARTKFVEGIQSLARECNATWLSGSGHDEIGYIEILEKELEEHIGDQGVEIIRQAYERQ